MRIIISPAKQMRVDTDTFACTEVPIFMDNDRYITCVFGEREGEKVVQKGVYAKMARGEMVRFMSGIQAEEPEQIQAFHWSGYHFDESRSSDTEYVFIREEIPGKKSSGSFV